MFLNDKTHLLNDDENVHFDDNYVILRELRKTGSLFIACLRLGISIEDVELWYKLGQESDDMKYIEFFTKVNNIEKKYGFNIVEEEGEYEYTVETLNNFNYIGGFRLNPSALVYIQQNNKEYKITNIFKSHDSKKIYLSINQENNYKSGNATSNFRNKSLPATYMNKRKDSNEILIPKFSSRNYDFNITELKTIIKDLNNDTQIYVLKEGKAYVFGWSIHYDYNYDPFFGKPENKLIVEINTMGNDCKYNKIEIDNPYYYDIPYDQRLDIIEDLKRYNIIIDGFFEAGRFYYTGDNDDTEYCLTKLIQREVDRYYNMVGI